MTQATTSRPPSAGTWMSAVLRVVLLAAALAVPLAAQSQSPAGAQSAVAVPSPAAQAQQQKAAAQAPQASAQGPGIAGLPGQHNISPAWRDVRSGKEHTTTTRGREAGVLIQSGGETWRQLRNGPISQIGGWLLVLVFAAIGVFYKLKGTIPLHEQPTGNKVRRFSDWERIVHWSTAISFCILAVSGLIILFGKHVLLPVIGYTLFAWLTQLAKGLHNFVGPVFILAAILLFAAFLRDNLPRAHDFIWVRKFGGLFSGEHVPSHRFNAGEKAWFWGGLAFLGIINGASGLVLDFPNFDQTRNTMQIAHLIHLGGALLFIAAALGHIYMGTLGVEGAYQAMRTGEVDEMWIKEHHQLWYDDWKAGKIRVVASAPEARSSVTASA